jgi:light-regulated signal transduction histidine kinase (bacteriophytochrome)
VEVGCDQKKDAPVFYVRDNGIGIPPQHKESVFRIFKRLHEQNKYGGGTGAGLTIVKKIVERHGGRIWLESVPGEGTTFYFTLTGEP